MTTTEIIFWATLTLTGIFGSSLCSGLEVGLYSVSRVLIRIRSVDQPKAKTLHTQLQNPAPALPSLLIYNNIFNYITTLAITALLASSNLNETVQAILITPILLIFAESIPKEIFRSRANSLMERLVNIIVFMRYSFTIIPVAPIITFIAVTVSKLLGADLTGSVRDARQHMTDLIKHADEQITQSQTEMIDRALQLNQTPVRTAMTPLTKVIKINTHTSRQDALKKIQQSNHSRYPVINPDGQIIGSIHTIDLYTSTDNSIKNLIQPIVRLNIETSMRQALTEMNQANARLAIVTRSGQDTGLITRKDLLSPLINATHDW